MTKSCISVVLLSIFGATSLYGAAPEFWVVPLDNHVPWKTPQGHLVNTIAFVLRIRGGGGKYQAVDLYESLSVRLSDSSGRVYQEYYSRNSTMRPTDADILPLISNETRERCYVILLKGSQLYVADGTGGAYYFDGMKKGKVRLEVGFSGRRNPSDHIVREFEKSWDNGSEDYFYRTPTKCGSFVIEIQSIEKEKKQSRVAPPVTAIPGL